MIEEKRLVKSDNGLLQRLSCFIRKIFSRKGELKNTDREDNALKDNLITELGREREVREIQEKYEKGIIKEEELTEEEKKNLIELYKKQIQVLEENNEGYRKTLKLYDEEILKIRNKIKGNNN